MESLTRFGIDKSRFTILVMVALLLLGGLTYRDLSKREDPSITIRMVVVVAEYPGMSPEKLETLIAEPLERTARKISEVDDINTLITTGRVEIHLEIDESVAVADMETVKQDIRNKINAAQNQLPPETQGPHINTDYGDVVIATVAVTGEGFDYAELRESAKALRKHLYTIDGIGKVTLMGVQEERIWLELNSRKLASIGVQIPRVLEDLQAQNVILPAGSLDTGERNIILEANGDFKSIDEIKHVLTRVPDLDTFVQLEDLLTVRHGYVDPKEKPVYFNGEPAVMVGIEMSDGQDIQVLGKSVVAATEKFEKTQPIGISYRFSTYQEAKVTIAINDALMNVAQTALVVLLVLMLFLGVRPALIVACIVPFTVMFALILMAEMQIALQVVSIAAVIISLGLLVDNGLVIVEDIQRKISSGIDPREAALGSSQQFGTPLAVASITTVAAFIPLLILEGTEGEYAFSLGGVVGVMLLGSWLTALYLLPPLAVWLSSKKSKNTEQKPSRLVRLYSPLVRKTLSWSVPVLVVAYALVALSGNLFGNLRSEMFPLSARNQFLIYLDMPKGTSLPRTEQEALAVERWLSDPSQNPEVTNTTVYVGDGGPRFYLALSPADTDPASAFILVNTTDFEGALAASDRAQRYLYEQHPAARAKVKRLSMGGEESGIVEVKISGSDANKLLAFADQVEARLHQAPGIMQNENDWGNKVLKIGLNVAQDKARSLGITSKDVSEIMNTFFSGYNVSEFRAGDEPYPITVRLDKSRRDSLEDLGNLSVPSDDGLISLDQVASFSSYAEFSQLRRENQIRTIKISGKSSTLTAQELLEFIQPTLDSLNLPEFYTLEIDGEIASNDDVNNKLGGGMPLALMVMFAAIMFQFNSVRRAGLIFATIPLIIIGVPLALLAAGQPLSFFGMLGIISLAGIIINNAIVLIDQIDIERRSLELKEAIVSAAEKRVTPILLTTLTTVVGLTPMAINGGALFEPMATLMIGGLLCASVITLFFVPSAFYLLFKTYPWQKD